MTKDEVTAMATEAFKGSDWAVVEVTDNKIDVTYRAFVGGVSVMWDANKKPENLSAELQGLLDIGTNTILAGRVAFREGFPKWEQ